MEGFWSEWYNRYIDKDNVYIEIYIERRGDTGRGKQREGQIDRQTGRGRDRVRQTDRQIDTETRTNREEQREG